MKYNLSVKKIIIAVATLSVIGGFTSSALNAPTTEATDEPPIVKEVERQGEVLENHEGRITNAENDVKALQDNTSTAPATERVVVKEVLTQPTQPTQTQIAQPEQPAPIVVVAYEQIPTGETADCKYTYSDGTTYQWNWKTINPQGSWVTDGVGQNGHWVTTTNTSNYCDQRAIGLPKA